MVRMAVDVNILPLKIEVDLSDRAFLLLQTMVRAVQDMKSVVINNINKFESVLKKLEEKIE